MARLIVFIACMVNLPGTSLDEALQALSGIDGH
jgi:hypothetical protein